MERNTRNYKSFSKWCDGIVRAYLKQHPDDSARLSDLMTLIGNSDDIRERLSFPSHLTASGLIVDTDSRSLLLIYNRGLHKWLQPGGHLEPGETPLDAARREVLEEVGLSKPEVFRPGDVPIDIDCHRIPANAIRGEPEHTHYDFRYAFLANRHVTLRPSEEEVDDIQWVNLDGPETSRIPENLHRAITRVQALLAGQDP